MDELQKIVKSSVELFWIRLNALFETKLAKYYLNQYWYFPFLLQPGK
jgi:hypothetical protein